MIGTGVSMKKNYFLPEFLFEVNICFPREVQVDDFYFLGGGEGELLLCTLIREKSTHISSINLIFIFFK